MASRFDENGYMLPPPEVTAEEKQSVLAYAKAVYVPNSADDKGLALSSLRKPQSAVPLQRLEAIANALVADGELRVVYVQSAKNGWNVYHPVNL